ncbi:MAG: universal stress protein [Desulfobacterales bacterium]
MYNTVLVPLDGSPRAEAILAHLPAWVSSPGGEIVLLLVVQAPIVTAGFKTISVEKSRAEAQRLIHEGRDYLDQVAQRIADQGFKVRSIVEVGAVVETIMAVAEREAVDLVAMASHGRSGLSWVFYGSVASGVLQQVDRPLVLIRSRES